MNLPEGYKHRLPELRGTARVLETGFDTDEMMRYAVLFFEPALPDGRRVHYLLIGAVSVGDGEVEPRPMSDEEERASIRRTCRAIGYELVG